MPSSELSSPPWEDQVAAWLRDNPDVALNECRRELAERHLVDFIHQAWPIAQPGDVYSHNWHIDAIAEHLEACARGEIRRLIINIPPRCMKSLTCSVFFPCWVWTTRPTARWVFASYAQSLSVRDSVACRRLIESPWYQANWGKNWQLAGDQNVKIRYDNTARGYRITTSVDGAVTGEGGDFCVLDDPHNAKDGESDAMRKAAVSWVDNSWMSRVTDPKKTAFIVIMQRLHEEDVTGHLLAKKAGWEHLCLPAEYEGPRCQVSTGWADPRTKEGELLWPDRFGAKEVEELKRDLGPYGTAGQLQQRPAPAAGGMFDRSKAEIVDHPPTNVIARYRAWDLAASTTDDAKETASIYLAKRNDNVVFVMDCIADKWEPGPRDQVVHTTAKADGHAIRIGIEKEPGSGGLAQIDTLKRLLIGYSVEAIEATGDKEVRAGPVSSYWNSGLIKIVKGPWNEKFLSRVCTFPTGKYKDVVDALAHAFNQIAGIVVFEPLSPDPKPASPNPLTEMLPKGNPYRDMLE